MTRGADGTWSADFTGSPNDFPNYYVFDFEDEQHRSDRNNGDFWDFSACYMGKSADFVASAKAQTYIGGEIAPGMRRHPDISRAIAYLRQDFEQNPQNDNDLFSIWTDELLLTNDDPATFEKIGRELVEVIAQKPGDNQLFRQTVGFVAPYALKLPPEAVTAYRNAVLALPDKTDAGWWDWSTQSFHHIPKTEAWKKRIAANLHDVILARLDYFLIAGEADPKVRIDRYLEYAKEYSGSDWAANAFISAFNAASESNNADDAERVYRAWSQWDPKNPDPPADLARFYIDRKVNAEHAVNLLNEASVLFQACNPRETRSGSDKTIKAHSFALIAPFSGSNGEIEFLRGQAYLLLNQLPEARADLEMAVAAMPDRVDIQYAVGEAREKTGNKAAALEAYLTAASAPYDSTQEAREAYERLFVALRLGSTKAADKKLFARIEENDKKLAEQYTPVPLNQPAPKFMFHEMNGKRFDSQTTIGKPTVIDFWSVWCGACTLELPALQAFQHDHPEVNLLTVAIDQDPQEVRSFLEKKGLKSLHVAVVPEVPEELTSAAYPTTIVLDASGRLQFVHDGVLPDVPGYLQKDLSALESSN